MAAATRARAASSASRQEALQVSQGRDRRIWVQAGHSHVVWLRAECIDLGIQPGLFGSKCLEREATLSEGLCSSFERSFKLSMAEVSRISLRSIAAGKRPQLREHRCVKADASDLPADRSFECFSPVCLLRPGWLWPELWTALIPMRNRPLASADRQLELWG
jgi:hypothetical protein